MVNSYRYAFAASTSTIPVSGTTVDLGIGELGVFDGKTWQATNGLTAKSIVIAQGTDAQVFPQGIAKGNQTYKTGIIKGSAVKSWKKVNGQEGQGMVVTLGFDGVDTTKGLTVKQGKSFTYWVTLSGAPIANLLGDSPKTHYAVWTEQFTVQLPCVSECVDNCGDLYDQNVVADAVIEEFNKRKLIGGQLITDYVKATKLVDCGTPSGLPTVDYCVYTLTIADAGDQAALGAVQAQYPGLTIKRTKRNGLYSTYEVVISQVGGNCVAPSGYAYTPAPVLQACDTCPSGCPSGYTLVEGQDIWIVTRPITGSANLNDPTAQAAFAAAVKADYDAHLSVTTTAEFLSFNTAAGSVKLYVPTGTAVTPDTTSSDFVVEFATNQDICTWDGEAITTAWEFCKECTAAQKNFTLTVLNDCTNTPSGLLTELRGIYGEDVDIAPSGYNADTCTTQFILPVESLNKDCEKCADVTWTFAAPAPFKGLVWTEVLGNAYGTDCVTGVRFESVYEQRKTKECFLKQVAYEFEPLFITLSTRNPDPNDYSVLCETDVPHTLVRNVTYPKGKGRVVADHVIASNFQFNQPWRKNPAERDALAYELGIDLEGIYDQYVLEFETYPAESSAVSGFGVSRVQTFEASFFFPVGTGGNFETVVTAFVSANSPLALEVI
jgi:hypothetical protein